MNHASSLHGDDGRVPFAVSRSTALVGVCLALAALVLVGQARARGRRERARAGCDAAPAGCIGSGARDPRRPCRRGGAAAWSVPTARRRADRRRRAPRGRRATRRRSRGGESRCAARRRRAGGRTRASCGGARLAVASFVRRRFSGRLDRRGRPAREPLLGLGRGARHAPGRPDHGAEDRGLPDSSTAPSHRSTTSTPSRDRPDPDRAASRPRDPWERAAAPLARASRRRRRARALALSVRFAVPLALAVECVHAVALAPALRVDGAARVGALAAVLVVLGLAWGSLRMDAIASSVLAARIGESGQARLVTVAPARRSQWSTRVLAVLTDSSRAVAGARPARVAGRSLAAAWGDPGRDRRRRGASACEGRFRRARVARPAGHPRRARGVELA